MDMTQNILEAALMVAGRPLTIVDLQMLFDELNRPDSATIKTILKTLIEKYTDSGIELKELASGFQFQAKTELSPWLMKLWEERPPRYSRAFLETLSMIAYRQPITRAEIEEIRGVSASSHIMRTLMEREWIRIIGYRDLPGKPAIYGTTKAFLDHFNLKNLESLPTLSEITQLIADKETPLPVQFELTDLKETLTPIITEEINTET